jgi:hypothetical protein
MRARSSTQHSVGNLAPLRKARLTRFLEDVANLKIIKPGTTQEINYSDARLLQERYRDFALDPHRTALSVLGDEVHREIAQVAQSGKRTDGDREEDSLSHWFEVSRKLRAAWIEPDLDRRGCLVYEVRREYYLAAHPGAPLPPTDCPFQLALRHFFAAGDRAKRCANQECGFPFFIARKKNARYCSAACSALAQLANRRRWWAKHGPGWRKKRTAKKANTF